MPAITVILFLLSISVRLSEATLAGKPFQNTGQDNLLFEEDILFQSFARSVADCARQCGRRDDCVAFTSVKKLVGTSGDVLGLCRGYFALKVSGVTTAMDRAVTFIMSVEWLEQACTVDSDCPTDHTTQCFAGKCLCRPEHFYSVSSGKCVASCAAADLQTTFLVYPELEFHSESYIADTHENSLAACKTLCLNQGTCVAINYSDNPGNYNSCWRIRAFAADAYYDMNDANWNVHKQTCA